MLVKNVANISTPTSLPLLSSLLFKTTQSHKKLAAPSHCSKNASWNEFRNYITHTPT